jgi:Winged helix-turn helix
VRHHPAHVWQLLRYRLGWSVQRPRRHAAGRDQAAIDQWVNVDWPRIKKRPAPQCGDLLFRRVRPEPDPCVRSTWAPRGQPPLLVHPFNWKRASTAAAICYGPAGGGCQLAFHLQPGNYNTDTLSMKRGRASSGGTAFFG